MNLTTA